MAGMEPETELQQLSETLPQYEAQIRTWSEQLDAMASLRGELTTAHTTLKGLDGQPEGAELLVPVGHDTTLFAKLHRPDLVLTGIGSRVFIEAPLPEAQARLSKRMEEVDTAAKELGDSLTQLQRQHRVLGARAEELYTQLQERG